MTETLTTWGEPETAAILRRPHAQDDKYTRGVLGVLTGSEEYPGAAVLGVTAALHTGVGMVRYLGPSTPRALVLARRPEVVPGDGRLAALLAGSGMPPIEPGSPAAARIAQARSDRTPLVLDAGALVLDAGALGLVTEGAGSATIITPHAGELARLTGDSVAAITADPVAAARTAARRFAVVVLLKGARTVVAGPDGSVWETPAGSAWLSTAGTGDVLAGILGALVAADAAIAEPSAERLAQLAAAAATVHSTASWRSTGPIIALELAESVTGVIADLLGSTSPNRRGRPDDAT